MQLSRASTRIGLFALLLGVIVLSLFGSLFAADRALSTADHEAVDLDAHGAALIVERELRLDAEQLGMLFGPLLSRANLDSTHVPPAFDAAWVLDRDRRLVWSGGKAPALDTTQLRALSGDVARVEGSVQVRALGDSAQGR